MKINLAGILFLFILTLPWLATYCWLSYRKMLVREAALEKMEAGNEQETPVRLTFSQKEAITKLNWEHDREFEFEQEMYDVISMDTVGQMVIIWCIKDHEETKINAQLSKLWQGIPIDNKDFDRLDYFQKSLFWKNLPQPGWQIMTAINPAKGFLHTKLPSVFNTPPVPPPEIG